MCQSVMSCYFFQKIDMNVHVGFMKFSKMTGMLLQVKTQANTAGAETFEGMRNNVAREVHILAFHVSCLIGEAWKVAHCQFMHALP